MVGVDTAFGTKYVGISIGQEVQDDPDPSQTQTS